MKSFFWKREYSVGVDVFDAHHKKLVKYINEMLLAESAPDRSEKVSVTLGKLIKYARMHFDAEERYLELSGYPEKKSHKKEHEAFVKQVVSWCAKANYKDQQVYDEVCQYLQDWLQHHILEIDMQYSFYFKENGLLDIDG